MTKTRGELLRFLLIGSTTVLIDWMVYRLTMAVGLTIGPAKTTGFLTGTLFAFFANRQWTFTVGGRRNAREAGRFIAVYGATLIANVGVNSAALAMIDHDRLALVSAFVIATGVSATLNFLGMKFIVFRPAAP